MKHPLVKAGGFTGSRIAGRILMDVAASRPEPIPFYAEMSSTNPVFILPGALRERRDAIASGLHGSFTLGAGQFCTKPGMVFLAAGFRGYGCLLARKLDHWSLVRAPFHLLTKVIHESYASAVEKRRAEQQVKAIAEAACPNAAGFAAWLAGLFETDAETFLHLRSGVGNFRSHHASGEPFQPRTGSGHCQVS